MAERITDRLEEVVHKNLLIASIAIGAIWGVAIESHTDEVARGKILTATTCQEIHEFEDSINPGFLECIQEGVPGGRAIGSNDLEVGDDPALVSAYIRAQENEQGLEPQRILGWAAAGAALSVADWII